MIKKPPGHSVMIKPVALMVSCAAVVGCIRVSGPDCRDETRNLAVRAQLESVTAQPQPGDTGSAVFSLHEARNAASRATSAREVLWFVGSGLERGRVTAVHVHEVGTNRLLFDIPLTSPAAPPYVITQVFTRRPYAGSVSWTDLYDSVGSERAYVDVHTTDHPGGQLRGALRVETPGWQTFTRAYCS